MQFNYSYRCQRQTLHRLWSQNEDKFASFQVKYILYYIISWKLFFINSRYRISSYSFCGNYFFWSRKCGNFSNSFRNMAIFYFINWIDATETIEGGKVFKGGNYLREEAFSGNTVNECFSCHVCIYHIYQDLFFNFFGGSRIVPVWLPYFRK